MIIDTSAILAIFFKEKNCAWVADQMKAHASELKMSTVSLTETLILLQDRQPKLFSKLEEQILCSGIRFITPDVEQARIAAKARIKFPLNLGDCFVYALAVQENSPILTLDKDFNVLTHEILFPLS